MDSENQIFVFATTLDGTSAALRHAAKVAGASGARVVLLVPRIVEYGTPLNGDCDESDIEILTAPFRALARRAGVDVIVRCGATREPRHLPGRLQLGPSRIIVGGPQRGWRRTSEQRLARELSGDGHDVTFVDAESGQPQVPGVAVHA
jgi:hypothetical protein